MNAGFAFTLFGIYVLILILYKANKKKNVNQATNDYHISSKKVAEVKKLKDNISPKNLTGLSFEETFNTIVKDLSSPDVFGEFTKNDISEIYGLTAEKAEDIIRELKSWNMIYSGIDQNSYNIMPDINRHVSNRRNHKEQEDTKSSIVIKLDSKFEDVAHYAIKQGHISISEINRNFEVGFNRAGRIMLQLEQTRIVSMQIGGTRKILATEESFQQIINDIHSGEFNFSQGDYARYELEQEKSEIATKIIERHRRQQLEKIVRQELIDSGELFGEAPKREPIPREIVDAVYKRDGGRCVYCGSTANLQLDHIIPFSKGGATSVENLQLLCQKCNIEKSNKIG